MKRNAILIAGIVMLVLTTVGIGTGVYFMQAQRTRAAQPPNTTEPKQTTEKPTSAPTATANLGPRASAWQCLAGTPVPLRFSATGQVECMSSDGKNCAWQTDDAGCTGLLQSPVSPVNPLSCGEQHQQLYGITGYDTPEHWCSKGKVSLKP